MVELVTLAEAIQVLREELEIARANGENEDLEFEVGTVEVEFAVMAQRSGKAKVGFNFFVPIGAEGSIGREETHRVRLTLSPRQRSTGSAPRISDRADTLPSR